MSVRVPGLSFSLCKAPVQVKLILEHKGGKGEFGGGGGGFGESSVIHQTKLFK